jgi:hypothetical protein
VVASGCGVTERWVAAVKRWDETTACLSPDGTGVSMVHFTGFHRFFGGDSTDDYACSGDPRPVRATSTGATWTTTCTGAEETVVHHGTVVGVEEIDAGGTSVRTIHVTDVEDDGDPRSPGHRHVVPGGDRPGGAAHLSHSHVQLLTRRPGPLRRVLPDRSAVAQSATLTWQTG